MAGQPCSEDSRAALIAAAPANHVGWLAFPVVPVVASTADTLDQESGHPKAFNARSRGRNVIGPLAGWRRSSLKSLTVLGGVSDGDRW